VETIGPVSGNGEAAAAAAVHRGVCSVERDFEVGLGWTDNQAISKAISAKGARIADADKVSAVFRCGEKELGISAEFAVGIVVIGVVEMESRQAVLNQLRAGWMRLDHVARFIQSMGGGTGVEVI